FWTVPHHDTTGLIDLHQYMLSLQTQVPIAHPYQSVWWQWMGNARAIWYLYEVADGAQRGIMLIGNPVTMWFGLLAMAWCAWAGWREKRKDMLALVLLYVASLALWVFAPKAVQFYFHYFLPGMFVSGALALGVERLWQRGERLMPWAIILGALGLFVYWLPILNAAPLGGEQDFLKWAWTAGWR
ncbi:MAG: phospholipid carrier-dependent glycosyltransferase, partial [Alteraurantiacibacter sp.]